MSVSNELNSEIAVALLKQKALHDNQAATQILLQAYEALRELTAKERRSRIENILRPARPTSQGAISGAS